MHTFPPETKLQYLGLNLVNAEFLAPLFSSQHLVPEQILGKCELRDVIHSPLRPLHAAQLTFSLAASNTYLLTNSTPLMVKYNPALLIESFIRHFNLLNVSHLCRLSSSPKLMLTRHGWILLRGIRRLLSYNKYFGCLKHSI